MLEYEQIRLGLSDMKGEIDELGDALGISAAAGEAEELRKSTASPDFYSNLEKAQGILQRIKRLDDKIGGYNSLARAWDDLSTLVALADEEEDISLLAEIKADFEKLGAAVQNLRLETLLSGRYDKNNAILSIHAGAGGTEAQDWAQMLFRMYQMWAERRGFAFKTLDFLSGDEAGLKSIVMLISGANAYGYLKSEKGVHRLVRISPFDSSGRRHTSFASVDVMPEIEDDIEININAEDLKVDTYRASGAGGQHINKTDSAVRITHLPTGVVVTCQNERSQHKNRETAMKMLKAKLVEIAEREQKERIEDIKGVQKEIGWGSQIRSYVFHPYSMVKDHRTNEETGNISAVMNGELDGFINSFLKALGLGRLMEK